MLLAMIKFIKDYKRRNFKLKYYNYKRDLRTKKKYWNKKMNREGKL